MALFQGLLDDGKYIRVLEICLKDGNLEQKELEALSQWSILDDNGIEVSVMAKVLKIRDCLHSPLTPENEKSNLLKILKDERKVFGLTPPAEFPKINPEVPSKKLVDTLDAYIASIILESHNLYRDVIDNKDPNAVIHSNNLAIRRGIGYALFEMASQASNKILSNQDIVFNPKTIINETLEGVSRGASESVINNLIPKEYQATAKIVALGAIRSSFNAIIKGHDLPNWLKTACGSAVAGALSNNLTTYIGNNISVEDKKKVQEYIDFTNTVIVKAAVQGLASKSFQTGMYTLLTATAKDATFKIAGGVEALKDRDVAKLMQAALPLDVLKKIIDSAVASFSNAKVSQNINNIGVNDAIALVNLGINIHNFANDPSKETLQELYTDTTHFISTKCGFTYGTAALAALDIGSKVYQGEHMKALYSAVEHAAYMAIPMLAKENPAFALVGGAMVSAYVGYQIINHMTAEKKSNENSKTTENTPEAIAQGNNISQRDASKEVVNLDLSTNMQKAIDQLKEELPQTTLNQFKASENTSFTSPKAKAKKTLGERGDLV